MKFDEWKSSWEAACGPEFPLILDQEPIICFQTLCNTRNSKNYMYSFGQTMWTISFYGDYFTSYKKIWRLKIKRKSWNQETNHTTDDL